MTGTGQPTFAGVRRFPALDYIYRLPLMPWLCPPLHPELDLVNVRDEHADVRTLRFHAIEIIGRIEGLQRHLMEAQPQGRMTIRSCEFYLSCLLILRELVNHYEIASLLEEQVDTLAKKKALKAA